MYMYNSRASRALEPAARGLLHTRRVRFAHIFCPPPPPPLLQTQFWPFQDALESHPALLRKSLRTLAWTQGLFPTPPPPPPRKKKMYCTEGLIVHQCDEYHLLWPGVLMYGRKMLLKACTCLTFILLLFLLLSYFLIICCPIFPTFSLECAWMPVNGVRHDIEERPNPDVHVLFFSVQLSTLRGGTCCSSRSSYSVPSSSVSWSSVSDGKSDSCQNLFIEIHYKNLRLREYTPHFETKMGYCFPL